MARRRLTDRQKARIGAIQERRRARLEAGALEALTDSDGAQEAREGVVVTRHGQNLAVADGDGNLHHCLSRQSIGQVACGDRVVWQSTTPGQGVVTARLERSTALIRPTYGGEAKALAANITQLVIVLAPQPPPGSYLIDQYLVAAENIGVRSLLALNKRDLLDPAAEAGFMAEFGHYAKIGYPVILISAKFEHGLDPLIDRLAGQTSILVGQSGVGKSSLVNALIPDLDIQVGRLSEASGTGRHTTSTATLYTLPLGGRLIDSPGVRSFRLGSIGREQLALGFREFRDFLGHCRFSNCSHTHEEGCALIEAVSAGKIHPRRLENYLHMEAGLASV